MLKRTASIVFCLMLTCVACFGQSKYNNQLQPGLNTRSDAERALGRPIRALSATVFEYAPPEVAERLIVQYRSGSAIIERIELQFRKSYSRSAMISTLKLPDQPDAKKTNAEGKLVEYFGDAALVFTYASGEAASGVKSIGYYSRELLESAAPELRRNRQSQDIPSFPTQSKTSSETKTKTQQPASTSDKPALFGFGLAEDTPVKLRLTRTLSSKDAKVDDKVDFEVLEDVKVEDAIVIQHGGFAIATVTEAHPKRTMGRAGKLTVNIDYVQLVSGDKVPLRSVKGGEGGSHTGAMTGAMVATGIVFFPAAPLFLFMHGKDITIPKGTEITAYIAANTPLDKAKFVK